LQLEFLAILAWLDEKRIRKKASKFTGAQNALIPNMDTNSLARLPVPGGQKWKKGSLPKNQTRRLARRLWEPRRGWA
jgi:hypothetical protein